MALINIRKVKTSSTLLVRSSKPSSTCLSTINFFVALACLVRFYNNTARIVRILVWSMDGSKVSNARAIFLVKGRRIFGFLLDSSARSDRRKMRWE